MFSKKNPKTTFTLVAQFIFHVTQDTRGFFCDFFHFNGLYCLIEHIDYRVSFQKEQESAYNLVFCPEGFHH